MESSTQKQFTVDEVSEFLCGIREIIDIYGLTLSELLHVASIYAEWQDLTGIDNLEETLYMEDNTPMTPSLTQHLYHQMYNLFDIYDYDDEEDIINE